jgi:hypothetical protein
LLKGGTSQLTIVGIMAHEFKEFALDWHNYSTWAMDVKITLTLRGMYEVITPPAERHQELLSTYKYNSLYITRHCIHRDLKSEYVLEEETSTL